MFEDAQRCAMLLNDVYKCFLMLHNGKSVD